jgi:Type I phosphodiesterase / nucleotide pyrophosphatase
LADRDDDDSSASNPKSASASAPRSADDAKDAKKADPDTPPKDPPSAHEDSVKAPGGNDSADQQVSAKSLHADNFPDISGDIGSTVTTVKQSAPVAAKKSQIDTPATSFAPGTVDVVTTAATTFGAVSAPAKSAVPPEQPTLVSVVSDAVSAVLQPLLSAGTGSPNQAPVVWAMLSAVRDEMERIVFRRTAYVAPQQTTAQLVDPTAQHVLVIGVDGTNLSRVLADPTNTNFFDLMNTSTNSAPSIVGHTTISNPSWTAILTGAWDNKTGVINNVFTPWTYDNWPTAFNQLEAYDSDIETKAIADWSVIAQIAGAGSIPADEVVPIPQIAGDTNWSQTDAAVTAEAVKSILGTDPGYEDVPNFLFTYLVQVDENGHMFGGASPEYAAAISRTDDNLGAILGAVAAREAAACAAGACEDWTAIVVTDHGHQPQKGVGHGFQSPDETDTFVIADGPAFGNGLINPRYQIVDVTLTVLSLFGAPQPSDADGVPLMTLSQSDLDPVDLHQALLDQIAANKAPGFFTNVSLSARTIFATVPYYVYTYVGQVPVVGDVLYVATNIPAQIVARLTGVTGASIFPLLPPPPFTPTPEQAQAPDTAIRVDCGDGTVLAAACIAS